MVVIALEGAKTQKNSEYDTNQDVIVVQRIEDDPDEVIVFEIYRDVTVHKPYNPRDDRPLTTKERWPVGKVVFGPASYEAKILHMYSFTRYPNWGFDSSEGEGAEHSKQAFSKIFFDLETDFDDLETVVLGSDDPFTAQAIFEAGQPDGWRARFSLDPNEDRYTHSTDEAWRHFMRTGHLNVTYERLINHADALALGEISIANY